jgi:pyruvate-formate lyase-activating enzyme
LKTTHPDNIPYQLASDEKGNFFEDTCYRVVGRSGNDFCVLKKEDFIELPFGSDIFFLPGRKPVGLNIKTNKIEINPSGLAVAAFVAPAYTVAYSAAWETMPEAPRLPLYAYSTVGWYKNKFYVPAIRIDPDIRQECDQFDQKKVIAGAKRMLKNNKQNRLLEHLSHCALVYLCPAARNYFLNRWEAPLPTSPTCNSQCLGCISYQPKQSKISSTQNRITFIPTPDEIAEIAIEHLNTAPNPVVSFGQGCEGEPLMVWKTIRDAIKLIRKKTSNGIINLNTNASKPEAIEELCKAGLQSIRVSVNSLKEEFYNAYYKPRNYSFRDVLLSLEAAKRYKIWKSLNYFVFPGATDLDIEYQQIRKIIGMYDVNMIQWRNFNIDPEWYLQTINIDKYEKTIGIFNLIQKIKTEFPGLYHGYFNPGKEIIEKYLNK